MLKIIPLEVLLEELVNRSIKILISITNPGGLDFEPRVLDDIVKAGGVLHPEPVVLERMHYFFGSQVVAILLAKDAELAKFTYDLASSLPSTATKRRLVAAGISIEENCAKDARMIILFGHRDTVPVALKRLTNPGEIARLRYLSTLNFDCPTIIRFELTQNNQFLLMPRLTSNLMDLNPLSISAQTSFYNDIVGACEYLHDHRMAHMDIKPENVGISEQGRFILIDIGNAARFGVQTDVTDCFVPTNFVITPVGLTAQAAVDYGLIATTLLAKLSPSFFSQPRLSLVSIFERLRNAGCAENVVEALAVRLLSFGFTL
jgi:serine/threonine protein kinase